MATQVTKTQEELVKQLFDGIEALKGAVVMVGPQNVPAPVVFAATNLVVNVEEMIAAATGAEFDYDRTDAILAGLALNSLQELVLNS